MFPACSCEQILANDAQQRSGRIEDEDLGRVDDAHVQVP
jgi:hypothetical protein